jgi:magnesium chelatase subunit D
MSDRPADRPSAAVVPAAPLAGEQRSPGPQQGGPGALRPTGGTAGSSAFPGPGSAIAGGGESVPEARAATPPGDRRARNAPDGPIGASLPGADLWREAMVALTLFAIDPHGLGGVVLRARAGPVRDRWMDALAEALPASTVRRRLPSGIGDTRLLGGLDLAATLAAGRPVAARGLLAEADGGVVIAPMAERIEPGLAARLAGVLDRGEVRVEREGFGETLPARVALVALDEGCDEDERVPAALAERLALRIDLQAVALGQAIEPAPDAADLAVPRAMLPRVSCPDEVLRAMCATALALGVDSPRAGLQALRAARAAAALAGRTQVDEADAVLAARLVLAPRATRLPPAPEDPSEAAPPPPDPPAADDEDRSGDAQQDRPLEDRVIEAVAAAVPAGLLAALQAGLAPRAGRGGGRAEAARRGKLRGRPLGSRAGAPGAGARLAVIDTLRAAAPWQRLRQPAGAVIDGGGRRLQVRREDFRIRRYRERVRTTTVFAVDASGSQALHRLGEAKGAVERLLADCYVRRDQVALVTFRGPGAELALPPTRSLTRARRSLAGLPGGGGTPLASGLDAAADVVAAVQHRGDSAVLVLITDGRGNLARDGQADRERARSEALEAAATLRALGVRTLLIDTSPRPAPAAEALAQAIGAQYLPLPLADAGHLSGAVRQLVSAS